jgi:hypothetical protein
MPRDITLGTSGTENWTLNTGDTQSREPVSNAAKADLQPGNHPHWNFKGMRYVGHFAGTYNNILCALLCP